MKVDDLNEDLRATFKLERQRLSIYQRQLAEVLGISQSALSHFERGSAKISRTNLLEAASIMESSALRDAVFAADEASERVLMARATDPDCCTGVTYRDIVRGYRLIAGMTQDDLWQATGGAPDGGRGLERKNVTKPGGHLRRAAQILGCQKEADRRMREMNRRSAGVYVQKCNEGIVTPLGPLVRRWRLRLELSQRALSDLSGYCWLSIHNLENGVGYHSDNCLQCIGTVIGVQLDEVRRMSEEGLVNE